jgi:hypothetical protein
MVHNPEGIEPARLSDDNLAREVSHLHATRHDTFVSGTEDALEAHTRRMLELEDEYLRRFPDRAVPHPLRTRAGSRAAAGQD